MFMNSSPFQGISKSSNVSRAVALLSVALLPGLNCPRDSSNSGDAQRENMHSHGITNQRLHGDEELAALHLPSYISVGSLSSATAPEISSEELVAFIKEIEDPELVLFILQSSAEKMNLLELSNEEKLAIFRHAIEIDPYQRYVRSLKVKVEPAVLTQLFSENGETLYRGEREGVLIEVVADSAVNPTKIFARVDGQELAASYIGRVKENGMLFVASASSLDQYLTVIVHASSPGLLLTFDWGERERIQMKVWKGEEIVEEAPPSIMGDVQRMLMGFEADLLGFEIEIEGE